MTSVTKQTTIPTYTLKESGKSGDPLFEISRTNGLSQQQKDLFFVPHRKNYYLLAFPRSGGGHRHWLDMVPHVLKPDSFYFTAPDQIVLKEDGGFEAIAISFTPEFLDMEEGALLKQLPIIQNPHKGHELNLSPDDIVFIEELCEKMIAEYEHKEGWRNSMLLAYMRVLLIYLSRLYTAQYSAAAISPDGELFNRFKVLVADHFTETHDVASYAGMLNLSTGHFSELIKKQSGKTPIEHIHDRLLLEAKRLLFHTDQSMKEIAFELGFEEASYFNRFFKRLTDSTPLSYRSTIREMYH